MKKIDWLKESSLLFDMAKTYRRDFHMYPELGFHEERSSKIIAKELEDLGYEVQKGVAKTGVIGNLTCGDSKEVVMLRFDMDALSIQEENECEYKSKNSGVMHACGHDGHMAIGLTVANLFTKFSQQFSGKIKLVFQPAEEGLGGAVRMIEDGALENPRPDYCFGLHLWNEKPLGWFGISGGSIMAGSDVFNVRIIGKGGHGAIPDQTSDPIIACAEIISSLQSIVSRNINPLDTAVLSVTQVRAGETFNVIPGYADFCGTIRHFSAKTQKRMHERFESIVTGLAKSFGCRVEISFRQMTAPLINNDKLSLRAGEIVRGLFKQDEIDTSFRTMGSEDMAFFLERIPGCFFFIGSANQENGMIFGHHHPCFDFDENALIRGSAVLAAVTADILNNSG